MEYEIYGKPYVTLKHQTAARPGDWTVPCSYSLVRHSNVPRSHLSWKIFQLWIVWTIEPPMWPMWSFKFLPTANPILGVTNIQFLDLQFKQLYQTLNSPTNWRFKPPIEYTNWRFKNMPNVGWIFFHRRIVPRIWEESAKLGFLRRWAILGGSLEGPKKRCWSCQSTKLTS